jgi:hypothetical protein
MPAKSGDAVDVCQPSLDGRDHPISLSLKDRRRVGYFGDVRCGRWQISAQRGMEIGRGLPWERRLNTSCPGEERKCRGVEGARFSAAPSAPPSGQGYSIIRPGEASPTDPREFGRCANFHSSCLEFLPRTRRPSSRHQRVAGHLRPGAPHKEAPFYPHSLCLHWLSYYSQILVRQRLVVTAFSARSPSASECFLSHAAKSALEKNVRAF